MSKVVVIILVAFLLPIYALLGDSDKQSSTYPMTIELNNKKSIPVRRIQINTESEKRLFDYVFKNAVGIYYKDLKVKLFGKYNIYNVERVDNSSSVIVVVIAVDKKTETALLLSGNNINNLNSIIEKEKLFLKNFSDEELKTFITTSLDLTSNSFRHFNIIESYKQLEEILSMDKENGKNLQRFKHAVNPIQITRTDKGVLVEICILRGDQLLKKVIEVDKQCKLKVFNFIVGDDIGDVGVSVHRTTPEQN